VVRLAGALGFVYSDAEVDVVEKLVFDGEFAIKPRSSAKGKVQDKVDKLSQTRKGENRDEAVSALQEEPLVRRNVRR